MASRLVVGSVVAGLALCVGIPSALQAQAFAAALGADYRETSAMSRATGTFDVKLAPQARDDYADGALLSRLTIDKEFHGDLTGTSKGQMLAAGTAVKGSAGYVAIELVTGTLGGRRGTFVFQHSGTMARGVASLTLTVVPDSGTGELTGLVGSMAIDIAGGKHSYAFEYTLPALP